MSPPFLLYRALDTAGVQETLITDLLSLPQTHALVLLINCALHAAQAGQARQRGSAGGIVPNFECKDCELGYQHSPDQTHTWQ